MSSYTLVEFRRNLAKWQSKLSDDDFYTKQEIANGVNQCYDKAKESYERYKEDSQEENTIEHS